MWFKKLLLIFFPFVFGLDTDAFKFSLDYFKYRDVRFICLVTCERNNYWSHKFVKAASTELITVSRVRAQNRSNDVFVVEKCINQRLTSLGVLIDSKCNEYEDVLRFASEKKVFDSRHKWLIIDDELNVYEDANNGNKTNNILTSVLANIHTSVDSDIVFGIINEFLGYNLSEVFNFGKLQGGTLHIKSIGSWSNDTGLNLNVDLNAYKYYRRWDFQQWQMRMIAVVENPGDNFDPKRIIGRELAPGITVFTQTSATILNIIAEVHNFRYNYTFADRWIGNFNETSNKVVGDSIYFQTQDISPVIRLQRVHADYFDVAHPPLTWIVTRYYYRIPTYGAGKFENQFLRPLSSGAWICVLAIIPISGIVLMLSAKFEHRPMPGQYALFSVVATLCQQYFVDVGVQDVKKISVGGKLTIIVTGLSCVLIYNYYTSSVVSWLLNGPPPSINSLEELLASPLELIYEDVGYTRSWLQTPSYYYNMRNTKIEDELRKKKVFNKKKSDPLLIPANEGIEMVKAGGYAYHTEAYTANILISRKFTQSELCEIGSLNSIEKTMLYPSVPKNSPYKEFLIWSLARLKERGLVSCIQSRTSSPAVSCEGSSPRALALGGAAPAFILLAAGYLLATVILLVERWFYNHFGDTNS